MEIELFTKPKGSYMICTVKDCKYTGQKPGPFSFRKSVPPSPPGCVYL